VRSVNSDRARSRSAAQRSVTHVSSPSSLQSPSALRPRHFSSISAIRFAASSHCPVPMALPTYAPVHSCTCLYVPRSTRQLFKAFGCPISLLIIHRKSLLCIFYLDAGLQPLPQLLHL
jgi:hypothetical protein